MAISAVASRIAQKEVRLFFSSPVAWLFLTFFTTTTLFTFFWVESFFARNIADIRPLFEWMPILLIFLCAALTMRMWSEERHRGTLEHVHTLPASLWLIVLGKFWACFTLLLLALISTLPLPITVALIADLDWGAVIGGYLATMLLGATYLALGLLVSARTDNPIVSLIGTVTLCAIFYLLGSATFTGFFSDRTAEILRLLGSGARFENITRGILDLRDLFYYISLSAALLILNVYSLESERWTRNTKTTRHQLWRRISALLLGNLLLANIWLNQMATLRLDMTQAKIFSISPVTLDFLAKLQEPLLIRGYFSNQTHPLLAPLVPQLRDLLREYELAGKGKVQVEFVDPAENAEIEQEANKRYGITSTPFQIADRHQTTLVNAYFNVLVRYGSEHHSLGFADLIEVRSNPNSSTEVLLRNPEYDITHAIKKVLFEYQAGGNLFEGIDEPVEFIGYVSGDELLPDYLLSYKKAIVPQLELAARNSGGKFSIRFIEPESRNGAVAEQIREQWGFKPMSSSPQDSEKFFFYLTLADANQVVQLPADNFDPGTFRLILDAGLKRFASDFTKIVALSVPHTDPQMAQYMLGAPTFTNLKKAITRDYQLSLEDLSDGSVTPEADILAVVAPQGLDENSVFAIDQFLMRGGTVVLATSPYTVEFSGGQLRLQEWNSGLQHWLKHNGLKVDDYLVLDKRNSSFHAPVMRQTGEYEFKDVQLIDYPYFIDLRPPELSPHPITGNLPQVTMAWASPITTESDSNKSASILITSSNESWLSNSTEIMPSSDADGRSSFAPPPAESSPDSSLQSGVRQKIGVVLQGRFDSFFADRSPPPAATVEGRGATTGITRLLERSPESSRIVLFSSNDFMDDQILKSIVAASRTQYLGPLELFMNTLDWGLQDEQLLEIRSHAHFNRTLPPMERQAQVLIEYFNYGLAFVWLLLIALVSWLRGVLRRRYYARGLSL